MSQDELAAVHAEAELRLDPQVNAERIGVSVNRGAATLSGIASSYREKWAAVRAAHRVCALQVVADEIEVQLSAADAHDDTWISERLEKSLRKHGEVPRSVRAAVRHGVVTLSGHVEWDYQRREAERLAGDTKGVCAVTNLITVTPHAIASDVQHRVSGALRRCGVPDAHSVTVTTHEGTVHLHGHVHSRDARQAAQAAALSAPGVTATDNEITIDRPPMRAHDPPIKPDRRPIELDR